MEIENLKMIKSEGVDVEQYEGHKNMIERIEEMEVPSQFNARGKQKVLKVTGEKVCEIEHDGSKIEIRPSEIFNLTENDDGEVVGYHEKGHLAKFMKKQKVTNPQDIVGTEAIIRSRESANGRTYLGYVF